VTIPLTSSGAGTVFAVRVVPRAGRTAVGGVRGDALLVRLAAAPVDGAANDALIAFLATIFDRPKRDITLVSGHSSRDKRVAVAGLGAAEISIRLDALLNSASER
jgi:uncharacterized protein (TIGR00251 family)